MRPTTSSPVKEVGDGAGSQKSGLGADHDLVPLQLLQGRPDAPLRALVAIVDGGVEEVDAALAGGDHRLRVGPVGRVVAGSPR